MGVDREGYEKWRRSRPWWYPLARDPYAPEFVPYWFKEAAQIRMPEVDPLPVCPIKTWEPDTRSQPSSVPTDGARNTWVDPTPTKRPPIPYPALIPGANDMCGFRSRYGVVVTGSCGLRHFMNHSEARALASWLMKMSAEEPT